LDNTPKRDVIQIYTITCSRIARCALLANNPKGWQRVAGGRNAVKTPGDGVLGFGILKGCQSAATPAGSVGNLGMGSAQPRLLSGKPPDCCFLWLLAVLVGKLLGVILWRFFRESVEYGCESAFERG
jgi:hypothetical protein